MRSDFFVTSHIIYAIFALLLSICPVDAVAQVIYLWPIADSDKYGKYMTSVFAEYRTDRFHAGMDIKTIWREGHKVVAVDDGSLYQLRVSPVGYGRAIYLRLTDGKIAVYAHLRSFEKKFQEIADEEQKKLKQYSIDLWFAPGAVPVKRGEILATTGRSGTRLQHLHFELRDRNNRPINPLANGFAVDDVQAPRPTSVSIRPMNIDSSVEDDWAPVIKRLNYGGNGVYQLSKPIKVWGEIGIALDVYDRNGTYDNNYGIYRMQLIVDGNELFASRNDQFDYSQNRLINLDRDYRLLRRDKGKFQKLYLDSGNTLQFYENYNSGDGIIHLRDTLSGNVPFEIIVGDYSGNTTSVFGELEVQQQSPAVVFPVENTALPTPNKDEQNSEIDTSEKSPAQFKVLQDFQDEYLRLVFTSNHNLIAQPTVSIEWETYSDKQVRIRAHSRRYFVAAISLEDIEDIPVRIHIVGESSKHRYETILPVELYRITENENTVRLPSNAGTITFTRGGLYKDIWMRHSVEPASIALGQYDIVSDIIRLEPKEAILRSNAQVKIQFPVTDSQPDKLGIYAQDNNKRWHYIGSIVDTQTNLVGANLSSLETITIIRDTIPPNIWRVLPVDGAAITNRNPEIAAWFDDEMAGIGGEDNFGLFLDGEKLIAEWDPILRKIFYISKETLSPGNHTARFEVKDRMMNIAVKTWSFTIR